MELERSRVMPADAEQVFDVAADASRVSAWVPPIVSLSEVGPNVVRTTVHGRDDTEGLFRAQPDQMRVEWGSRGTGQYAGWLQVYSRDGGRSEVNLHLSFFDELDEAYRGDRAAAVEADMELALDRLADEVGRGSG